MQLGTMQVAVDAVVFTVIRDNLSVLLIKRKYPPFENCYAIPGGFVGKDEDLQAAAKRELEEETGVKQNLLLQLGAYGNPKRDPRGRVLSVAYLALISADHMLHATTDALEARWFSTDNLPKLAFDHDKIIADALTELRYQVQTTNIAFQILPRHFTLTQIQALYEQVLSKKVDKRNFRKRIKELNIIKETNETRMVGAHRPARLYTFIDQKYLPVKDRVHVFI